MLTHKAPNTPKAESANTVDPGEMAHYEPSYLDLKCLIFQHYTVYIESFSKFCKRNFVVCFFLAIYGLT